MMKRTRWNGLVTSLLLAIVAATAALGADVAPGRLPLRPDTEAGSASQERPTLAATGTSLPTAPLADAPATATAQAVREPEVTTAPPPKAAVTASPAPAAAATVPAGPSAERQEKILGYSVQGRAITAERIGDGPIKVVLVGNIHGGLEANTHQLSLQLLTYFQGHPAEVPEGISLWIIPTMNPDGLATGHRWNANNVDLNRNADTDLNGCALDDWSPDTVGHEGSYPGAGGAYPFSEPETRAVRDFLSDAWVAVFYHSAAEAIYTDSCQQHRPTARLAELLSAGSGYPVAKDGWTGYPISGDMGDYLAGEGVAAVTVELTGYEDPEFERNLQGIRSVLQGVPDILAAEAEFPGTPPAELVWLTTAEAGVQRGNTGAWAYPDGSFVHPLALEVLDRTAYLLDGGRVLAVDLAQPAAPQVLLAPGDSVGAEAVGTPARVLEPLDLASDGVSLLALDRAADVYRYDPATGAWQLERYDRPSRDVSDHYMVAIAASRAATPPGLAQGRYLLETTHEQVWRYTAQRSQPASAWVKLPQSRDVDLSIEGENVYVLTRALGSPRGALFHAADGRGLSTFAPAVEFWHPRQVAATTSSVYVLDRAGRRLLALDAPSGALQRITQFSDRRPVSAFWVDETGRRLILAGRDTLYFYGEPDQVAEIEGQPLLSGPQPQDLPLLEEMRGLSMPIDAEGIRITGRDFQMPGAPRHYRLGVHEGIDFYGYTTGVTIDRTTAVHAVAAGVVLRALTDHQRLTAAQAAAWMAQTHSLGYTPPEVLDGYRGMQIWLDHGGGLVSRYAHLGSIAPEIVPGAAVEQGQVIGTVGNSGTPASVYGDSDDVHLHLELWLGDHYVGQFLRPIEAREWLERMLR